MTRTREENARDAMYEEELREAAKAVIERLPQLVPVRQMDYDDWLGWAADDLRANQGQYDDQYLPFMYEAVETAIFNRDAMNPWPAFTRALQNSLPGMPADVVVYEVDSDDGGRDVDCPNTVLTAARLVGGQIAGEIYTRAVSKEWLREFCLADEIE